MVIYSVCILLVIYTYQFENMPMYWRNTTHLSDEWLVLSSYHQKLRVILRTRVVYELIADEVCSTELAISHIRPELVSKITLLFYYIDNYCIRRFICHGNILTV
jgi:hypothetical protein